MAIVAAQPVENQSLLPQSNAARLAWLDFTRLIAAYSIVWLHTPRSTQLAPWAVLGRFAVPFFTAGAVLFVIQGLRKQPDRSLREYTVNRFRRIYLPFLAWCFIYWGLKIVKKIALPDEPNDFPGIEVLWTGTYWHLWFMPFILVVTLSTFVLGRLVIGRQFLEWLVATTTLAIGIAIASVNPPDWVVADGGFITQAWNALPAVCWGLTFAFIFRAGFGKVVAARTTSLIALSGFLALMVLLATHGRSLLVENASGLLLLVAALQPKSPRPIETVARFGAVAFGIYLAHPLVIKICEEIAAKLHWGISWQLDLSIFAIAAVGSTWLAWALARSRRTRWMAA